MPSGRTHDAITFLLAVPAVAIGYLITDNWGLACAVGLAFVFGGLMFGPDLDTVSRQYSRWGFLRFLWYPYRSFFTHRSRFSHGLLFGALIRVIYFLGVATLAALAVMYLYVMYSGAPLPPYSSYFSAWSRLGSLANARLGPYFLPFIFLGLWLGAASHTFTDLAGSYVKTGRIAKFL